MKLEYTAAEIAAQITTLRQLFEDVQLVDPRYGVLLDPDSLQEAGEAAPVPSLDEAGHGMQVAPAAQGNELLLYQGIQAAGRPCVLVLHCAMPHAVRHTAGAENSFNRAVVQYQEDLRRDYVTGVYNSAFLNEEYRRYAEKQALQGQPVGAVMIRINEYGQLRDAESTAAANCCLNTAAGILQLATGTEHENAALARLEDGLFAAVSVGTPAAQLARTLREAMEGSRRSFAISLSRRGTFTAAIASAEWGETSSWDMMLSLAQSRL